MAEKNAPLAGAVFVFTGELSISREEARSRVTLLGARVTTAISGRTTHLVVGADPGESKIQKAKSAGIKVLSEDEFMNVLVSNERKIKREIVDIPPPAASLLTDSRPWAEKYRPKAINEFIGNKQILTRLEEFLTTETGYKAALLSGPPGIGKTTAAHLVADSCGYEIIEFNASDVRNKSSIAQNIAPITENPLGLSFGKQKKRVIIMDEVDGMTSDRGGVPELVQVIKKTKVPIICICNDRNHIKMRTLASMSLDLRFRKPDNRAILARAKEVLGRECGQSLSESVINEIISRSNGDIRFVMSGIQSAAGARIPLGTFSKTADRTLFDFASEIFRKASIETKLNTFFEEYDMIPLFVHENYPKLDQKRTLNDLFLSAESISYSDVIDSQIHSKEQNWSLLPLFGFFGCVLPVRNSRLASRLDFPSFLGQNSKRLKMQRYVVSIVRRCKTKMTPEEMRLYALPLIAQKLLSALKSDPYSAASAVAELGLKREDLAEILESFYPAEYKSVSAKNKRAFTTAYNKMKPMLPYETGKNLNTPSSSGDELADDTE